MSDAITGADRGSVLGQPMLFECKGICVLRPTHECEMRGSLVYLLILNYFIDFVYLTHGI